MEPTKAFSTSYEAPTTLGEMLEPFSLSDLFKKFGEDYLYVPGPKGKFSALFPWDVLNTILRQHRLGHPRMRVFRDGKLVPIDRYTKVNVGRKLRSTSPKLIAGDLIGQLKGGATLVVDAVDELYEPLTTLAASLERDLREHIQVNLYAGWHHSPGFNVHWDDHDVIVLQLAGRKSWKIYGPTRSHPLANDEAWDRTPPETPVWEETISDGDLLYMPRGFWHVAVPLDEPSLHLTFGIPNRTGVDLMTWLSQRVRHEEIFRKDLPKFKCAEERAAHIDKLFDTLRSQLNDELIDDYFIDCDRNAMPRVKIDLPFVASSSLFNDLLDSCFVLTTPRKLRLIEDGDLMIVGANKKNFRFAKAARPILERLDHIMPANLDDLVDVSGGMSRDTVSAFIRELLTHGLIAAVHDR